MCIRDRMRTAPSSILNVRSTSAIKSMCPGVSMILHFTPFQIIDGVEARTVIPLRFSISIESVSYTHLARLLLSCRWWAICSLPVPFSPNIITLISVAATSLIPVSYTHLDVYKRQPYRRTDAYNVGCPQTRLSHSCLYFGY